MNNKNLITNIQKFTTDFGVYRFIGPERQMVYIADDNAQALIACAMQYEATQDRKVINSIETYLKFIRYCQQPEGSFFNYVNDKKEFTLQNKQTNLEEVNGRIIWALGYLISKKAIFPERITRQAELALLESLSYVEQLRSARAVAFSIKGLYYYLTDTQSPAISDLIIKLADRLTELYQRSASLSWGWFEDELTYTNSILPEAMVYAYLISFNPVYKKIAVNSFDFLLIETFNEIAINEKQHSNSVGINALFRNDPFDMACTIMTLDVFYQTLKSETYKDQMEKAFDWFAKNNERTDEHPGICAMIAHLVMTKYSMSNTGSVLSLGSSFKTRSWTIIRAVRSNVFSDRVAKLSLLVVVCLIAMRKLLGFANHTSATDSVAKT